MRHHRIILSLVGLFLAGPLLAGSVHAAQADHVHASHAWVRLLPAGLPAGGYVTLSNDGDRTASLTRASSPDYAHVMLHQSTMHDGMSTMTRVARIDVPAHGQVALAPGGYHLMLMQATHPLKPGDRIEVVLRFADGSTLPVAFVARPADADGPG